jgi:branched-chain amino acid aminotransferase
MPVWLNGERFEAAAAVPFDLADRGLLLGDGVFDTALALGGRIAFRDAHLERLAAACDTLGFRLDRDLAGRTMDAAAADASTGSVRLTVTRGAGPRGLAPPDDPRPTLFAANAPGRPALAFRRARLWPTPIRRNETSPAANLKTLGYLDAVLALGEAKRRGFDEAFFLNTKGRVASVGTGNLFVLKDGALLTPPPAEGVLPGIARGAVLDLGRAIGLRVAETPLEPAALHAADAVFMTNSLRLVAPVEAVGERRLAGAGPELRRLAEALCERIAAECGRDAASCLRPADVDP